MNERLHPGLHPDPDALNAFVEGVLPEHERVECLSHLAECGQCREVVFLAQQAAELEEPAIAPVAPGPLWRRFWRPLAIGSVIAAAMVGVFSFGLYRMTRPTPPQPQVIASTEAAAAAPEPAAQAEQPAPKLQPTTRKASPNTASKESGQPAEVPPPAPTATAPTVVAAAPEAAPQPAPVVAVVQVPGNAGVVGTITDAAGGAIASAPVELKNEDTGATYKSASNAQGQYSIAGLAPGRYDFTVTVPGFKKFTRPGVNVQPQEMARVDSTLQVGAATESVTVTAEASLLKTESGELSRQADMTALNQLPLLTGTRGTAGAPSAAYTLPKKSIPVSVATKSKLVVAVDPAGALFVSENTGKSWTRVNAAWKGKAERVVLRGSDIFELTTDPASTWVSTDGRHWSKEPASR